jgi:hypothetical protein
VCIPWVNYHSSNDCVGSCIIVTDFSFDLQPLSFWKKNELNRWIEATSSGLRLRIWLSSHLSRESSDQVHHNEIQDLVDKRQGLHEPEFYQCIIQKLALVETVHVTFGNCNGLAVSFTFERPH